MAVSSHAVVPALHLQDLDLATVELHPVVELMHGMVVVHRPLARVEKLQLGEHKQSSAAMPTPRVHLAGSNRPLEVGRRRQAGQTAVARQTPTRTAAGQRTAAQLHTEV